MHFGYVQRRHLVGLLPRRRLLKNQPLVLRLMRPNLTNAAIDLCLHCRHPYASTGAPASTFAAWSIVARAITSVAHHNVAFFNSGYHRPSPIPPTIFSSFSRLL